MLGLAFWKVENDDGGLCANYAARSFGRRRRLEVLGWLCGRGTDGHGDVLFPTLEAGRGDLTPLKDLTHALNEIRPCGAYHVVVPEWESIGEVLKELRDRVNPFSAGAWMSEDLIFAAGLEYDASVSRDERVEARQHGRQGFGMSIE